MQCIDFGIEWIHIINHTLPYDRTYFFYFPSTKEATLYAPVQWRLLKAHFAIINSLPKYGYSIWLSWNHRAMYRTYTSFRIRSKKVKWFWLWRSLLYLRATTTTTTSIKFRTKTYTIASIIYRSGYPSREYQTEFILGNEFFMVLLMAVLCVMYVE